jgi:hypothetical protein
MAGGFLVAFVIAGTSLPMIVFPLSTQVGGGLGTVDLTNTVLEVGGYQK